MALRAVDTVLTEVVHQTFAANMVVHACAFSIGLLSVNDETHATHFALQIAAIRAMPGNYAPWAVTPT